MAPASSTTTRSRTSPAPARMAFVAFAIIMLVAFVSLPSWGFAADTRSGSDITIPSNETITEDLYLAAGTVDFDGTAERDVNMAAGEANLAGSIEGSLNLAAGTMEISGNIAGSLRIFGGRVTLTGDVGGDVVVVGGQLDVGSSSQIGGNILFAGGQLDMRGDVEGDIRGYVGTASLGGTVLGSVDLSTSQLEVTNSAQITGEVLHTGKSEPDVASGARVQGGVTHESLNPWGDGDNPLSRASGSLLRTLWMLVTGALIVIAAPRLANQLGTNGKQLIPAIPLGLLAMIILPIVAAVLMITVIGFPAGFVLLTLFLVALYLTQAVVGMSIGRFILPRSWNDGSRGFHLLAMTLGVIIVAAFRFVPLPWVWGAVSLIVTIWGIGAILMLVPILSRQERTGV